MESLGIVTVIGAIISFIIAYFDKGEKKYEDLKDQYFEKVLIVFYKNYKKNSDINPVKFMKHKFVENEVFIPKYIYYLIENNDKEKLAKVLIVDYCNYYPNFNNSARNTINKLCRKIYIILLFIYTVYFVWGMFNIIPSLSMLMESINYYIKGSLMKSNLFILQLISPTLGDIMLPIWVVDLLNLIFIIILICLPLYIINLYLSKCDEYTLRIKRIKRMVSKKVNVYNRKSKKSYV
ncbi:MAG: hypothetical protein RSA29_17100 [Clostridium sp.]|uniref:hypothetical protein n=1 Tax=Clostridium sp. TaxID=1506 RepID=UPI00303B638B